MSAPITSFRDTIQKGGKFEPEKGRYHLYVSLACPWCTRASIVLKLKGLNDAIGVTAVSPRLGDESWPFASADDFPGAERDPLYDSKHVKDLYLRAAPNYAGSFSLPLLWDKKLETAVNNESADIVRIFNSAFDDLLPAEKAAIDLYPAAHRAEIDEVNEWVLTTINSGVYTAGLAKTQEAYEAAVKALFDSLDRLEKILGLSDYVVGGRLTEADVRLFVTIVRFDPAYVGIFKTNVRTIRDGYPAIHRWLRKLYWGDRAFSSTVDFKHVKAHYYWSHPELNPSRVIPVGPVPDILPL
ncbi:glutathione S-transferase [Trametes polyzona]|nr:glutathione S-transferase [Trametes polyzona]